MPINHLKTNDITDWTQADLDAQIAAGNFPPGTVLADIVLPSDWNAAHTSPDIADVTGLQAALDGKVDENAPITGGTATKIDYDAKGLVTGGAAATTADINDSSNRRYVTDAQLVVIGNTSGTNTGDITLTTIGTSGAASLVGQVLNIPNYADTDTGITQLTGDVTAGPGSGSQAATLATVNANVGQFGSATAVSRPTVNAKGLVTAIDTVNIAIPSTAVTDFTEAAQDAVGGIVNTTLTYNDGAPSLGINLSNANSWGATQTFTQVDTNLIQSTSSAGTTFNTNGASPWLHGANGGSANATAYGGWNFDSVTADRIAGFGPSKTLVSLDTATYPSLTELSYVKGVTSAIQTQLNGKQTLNANLTAIAGLATTDSNFIVGDGATWVAESGATVRTSLGLGTSATVNTGTSGATIPLLDGNNTHSGTFTASGTTTTLGSGTGAITANVGTGATTNGTTKTVNVGTAGVSGSITNINVGSAVAGSTGTTTLNSPTVAFSSVNTSITVSYLTASSALHTDASKKLVSVSNTGSGNNVLATSPTLVTPILGTPTSGTLTNCTGLPLSGTVYSPTASEQLTTTDTGQEAVDSLFASFNDNDVLCQHKALVVKYISATTVDIDATSVVLSNAAGYYRKFSSINLTVDITASGANGLDTGAEANSTWYHLWVIAKQDGTIAGLISASSTSPTMPATYVFKGYVGAVYNSSGGNFIPFLQRGNRVSQIGINGTVLSNGTATNYTTVSLSAVVPPTATLATFDAELTCTSGNNTTQAYIVPAGTTTSTTYGADMYVIKSSTLAANTYTNMMGRVILETAQQVAYRVIGTNARLDLYCTGWEF